MSHFISILINNIKEADKAFFLFLNSLHHPVLDVLMHLFSDRFFWIPFYFLLLLLIGWKSGWKSLLIVLPVIALVITVSDQLSVHLFKDLFKRYRPCHNEEIKNMIHLVSGCGGIYGFVSSHASNSFALAVFVGFFLKSRLKYMMHFMLIWALLVSYSRIYNGVHYPADIIGGALLGILTGWAGYKFAVLLHKYPLIFNRANQSVNRQ